MPTGICSRAPAEALSDRRREVRGPVFRYYHAVHARGFCGTYDSAKVMRVFHAVQDQHYRGLLILKRFLDYRIRVGVFLGSDDSNCALMSEQARQAVERALGDHLDGYTFPSGQPDNLLELLAALLVVNKDRAHGTPAGTQKLDDRV